MQIRDDLVAVFVVVACTSYLHNGDYFAIAFYILLTNYAKKWPVGALKNINIENERFSVACSSCRYKLL